MGKGSKQQFLCTACSAVHGRWYGQCNACESWNTIEAQRVTELRNTFNCYAGGYTGSANPEVQLLSDIALDVLPRFSTGYQEFDRVLGGGIVPGSVLLIGGHPGAGKSTLLLQTLCQLSVQRKALYITGEESLQQVALRAERLRLPKEGLLMVSETRVEEIIPIVQKLRPELVVIDSIQVMQLGTVSAPPGSVSQVRESAAVLTRLAKSEQITVIMVGHVTKEGMLAGPKVLEHCVDCSLLLEGDTDSRYRTLRSQKNRFGAVNELGIFGMTTGGLTEVNNPSAIFLNRGEKAIPGSIVVILWEGTRPLLVEIQALNDASFLPMPRRVAVGLDSNRVGLLLAVLHRHGGIQTANQDIFINVVGGVKVTETGADLALLLALMSSFNNKPLSRNLATFGEVGLGGEIRPVPNGQERIAEAVKHGFTQLIVPESNKPTHPISGVTVLAVRILKEALEAVEGLRETSNVMRQKK